MLQSETPVDVEGLAGTSIKRKNQSLNIDKRFLQLEISRRMTSMAAVPKKLN
jgi:hypothetical protein